MQPGAGVVNTALLLNGAGCGGGKLGAAGGTAVTTTVTVPTEARVVVVVPVVALEVPMVPRVTVQIAGEVLVQQLPLLQELAVPTPAVEVIDEIWEFGESVSVKIAPLTGSPWL